MYIYSCRVLLYSIFTTSHIRYTFSSRGIQAFCERCASERKTLCAAVITVSESIPRAASGVSRFRERSESERGKHMARYTLIVKIAGRYILQSFRSFTNCARTSRAVTFNKIWKRAASSAAVARSLVYIYKAGPK